MKNQSEMEDFVEQGFASKMRLLFDKTYEFWDNFENFQEENTKITKKELTNLKQNCLNLR